MAPRTELRGFLKQSQRTSEIADANLDCTGQTSGKGNEIRVRTKLSSRKVCVDESLECKDELVKYMSKLPSYLQGMERREESVQSNVLNVGVLDWGRLEKWKDRTRDCSNGLSRGGHRERSGKCEKKVSTTALTLPDDSLRCKMDDQVHNTRSNLGKVKASRDPQHSVHGVRCTLEPELASRDPLNKQEIASCSYKSAGKYQEGVIRGKSRSCLHQESTAGLRSEMGNSGGSLALKETKKRAEEIHVQEARESGKQCVVKLDGEEKLSGDSKEHEFSNIVLLRSRKQSRSTLPGEPQTSLDDTTRIKREVNRSPGLRSEIPRSCPLSLDLERGSEDTVLPLGVDLSCKKERFGGRRHSKTASRIFDQEIPEDESRKDRHPSPSKRFSFSFGRLSRSFTFKEDSSAQVMSSLDDPNKSDSMRFDGSVCPSLSSNLEKQNISRVSPLRRLLDPLQKSRGSEHILRSKGRSSSSNLKPIHIEVPLQDEKKQDTSRTRALFQLTIRNGIPLFQFVVDDNNNRCILGATMKTTDSSFKDESVQCGTFYSVNEAKKKKSGSWLLHGHREKQRGFVYNVIGQMRFSNSMSTDIAEQKCPVTVESVLFDESEKAEQRMEVAAVVMQKKPIEETSVIIPGGIHSIPEEGAPSPLISRWRSGGLCDCGGWDVGCKLHVLSNKTLLHEFEQSLKLFDQEGSEALTMTELKTGIYRVEFGSALSHLQAFFVCVTVITRGGTQEEELPGSKTITGKSSSSPFAPPLSPVGRV